MSFRSFIQAACSREAGRRSLGLPPSRVRALAIRVRDWFAALFACVAFGAVIGLALGKAFSA